MGLDLDLQRKITARVAQQLVEEHRRLVCRGAVAVAQSGALEVARANAARLGLEVSFGLADLLDEGRYDAVLANLPYVEAGLELEPEVSVWEPAGALFAGPDGLAVVRRLVGLMGQRRHRPSVLGLEIGPSQAAEASELVRSAGFGSVEVLPDLAGHDRVVVGRA